MLPALCCTVWWFLAPVQSTLSQISARWRLNVFFSIESRQLEALKTELRFVGAGGGGGKKEKEKQREGREATAESFIIVLLAGDKAAQIIHFHR